MSIEEKSTKGTVQRTRSIVRVSDEVREDRGPFSSFPA